MCVNSSFNEGDPAPWSHYSSQDSGRAQSLAGSIRAVYETIQGQIDSGSVARPEDLIVTFGSDSDRDLPSPLYLPDALGPWQPPHNVQTSWCSNPNIERHAGNARTSCIGCHQFSFTMNERRNQKPDFKAALTGDLPQFARTRSRKNFNAEFSWSFGLEFQPAIRVGKLSAGFNWPVN